jgi:hypothetical protein
MNNKLAHISIIFLISLFSLNLIFIVSQWISGFLITTVHVQDIVDAYEQVGTLQNEVFLGGFYAVWWANPFYIASLITSILLTICLYRINKKVKII